MNAEPRMMTRIARARLALPLLGLAGTLLVGGLTTTAYAGAKKAPAPLEAAPGAALQEAGLRFESARFLSGEIRFGLGRYGEAQDEFRQAEGGLRKTPFEDDAAFAAIQATEAAGRDADAAKAWMEWKGRYPQ